MSDSEDDFVEYGNALEPLEEDEIPRKKPTTLEDQVVKDAQGRRRFHGAFTGGFSAGFFNSVGSLEGWTPSSFKSSRRDRMDSKAQKPEDFMDDEDTGEFGIAPCILRATSDYSHLKRARSDRARAEGPIPGAPVLHSLLQPARETVGVRLLRRMGWRPGQGAGPRLSRVDKHQQRHEQQAAAAKVYGCSLPCQLPADGPAPSSPGSSSDEDAEEVTKQLTFAPDDVTPFQCQPKVDTFGLGYVGLDKRPVLSGHVNLFKEPPPLVINERNKKKVTITGQAFGVGALEEEDDDIYAQEDMSQYDFTLGGPSSSKRQDRSKPSGPASEFLDNFVKAMRVAVKEFFPPPALPQGFQPTHSTRKSRFDPAPPPPASRPEPAQTRTAVDRAAAVGEPCAPHSRQAEVEEEAGERQRLRAEALKITEKLAAGSRAAGASVAGAFQPFAGHPDKQKRYEQFLTLKAAGQQDKLSHLQPLSMTEWERQREVQEFVQASRLFRPLSGDMDARFVSASRTDDSTEPLPEHGADSELHTAAKAKFFGKLTRDRQSWQPCDLLCKRFNIAKPTVSDTAASSQKPRRTFSVFNFLEAAAANAPTAHAAPLAPAPTPATAAAVTSQPETPPAPAPTPAAAAAVTSQLETPLAPAPTPAAADAVTSQLETPPAPAPTPAAAAAAIPEPEAPPPPTPALQPQQPQTTSSAERTPDAGPELEAAGSTTAPADAQPSSDTKVNKELVYLDPPEKVDLFKAIFLSSSEESDAEEDSTELTEPPAPPASSHLVATPHAPAPFPLVAPSPSRPPAPAPATGVFANLDLDALSRPAPSVPPDAASEPDPKTLQAPSAAADAAVYGPRLPAKPSASSFASVRTLTSVVQPVASGEWVEKSSSSSHKKKKKHKKSAKTSKHKKHKHHKR